MLDRLISVIPEGNRKFPLKYKRMITSIQDRMYLAKNRYMLAHPIRTPAFELFKYILLNLDLNKVKSYKSDVDRYTEYFKSVGTTFRSVLDPNFSNTIVGGRFIDKTISNSHCAEILLNCEFSDPLNELPLDEDWSSWMSLRGIRLMYHDSMELPEDFAKSTLQFRVDVPSYMVIAVNAPVLCFKYFKYCEDCESNNLTPDVHYFIKQFEFANFFNDLTDIFIMNTLQRVFSKPDDSIDNIANSIIVPLRFCTTNMKVQGIEGILEFVNLLKDGSIKPQDFLATHWFENMSIMDKLHDNCYRLVTLPNTTRYLWQRIIHEMPYLSMLVTSVRSFMDGPLKTTFNSRCSEVWNLRINPVNLPATVQRPGIKDMLASWKQNLGNYLNGKDQLLPTNFTISTR